MAPYCDALYGYGSLLKFSSNVSDAFEWNKKRGSTNRNVLIAQKVSFSTQKLTSPIVVTAEVMTSPPDSLSSQSEKSSTSEQVPVKLVNCPQKGKLPEASVGDAMHDPG